MDKMNNINDINNITLNSNSEESFESESEDVLERVGICFDSNEKFEQSNDFIRSYFKDECSGINREGLPVKMTRATYHQMMNAMIMDAC